MLSNQRRGWLATLVLLAATGCSGVLPGAAPNSVTLAVSIDRNLLIVPGILGGREGRFIAGSATAVTLLDPAFAEQAGIGPTKDRALLNLGDRASMSVRPAVTELGDLADGIVGRDAWQGRILTVDYRKAVLILSRRATTRGDAYVHRFSGTPTLPVVVDGRRIDAVVDIASPDTLTLPASQFGPQGRRDAEVVVGAYPLGRTEVAVDPRVEQARIGNRLLSRFLLTIDYRVEEVLLWPDPRG